MKLKIVSAAIFSLLLLSFACNNTYDQRAALVQATPTPATSNASDTTTTNTANTNTANANASTATPASTSSNSTPHAVDVDGNVIPDESTVQPLKPIILAKDSEAKDGELKREAAFDHVKHSTDANYSVDGKTVVGCADCHHTDQPAAPAGQEYLKKFERKEMLTTAQLEKSKQPVKSCRVCHLQGSAEPTDEYPPDSITYAKETGKVATKDKITNEEAYHLNCNTCHEAARKRAPKSPKACADCHVQKKV